VRLVIGIVLGLLVAWAAMLIALAVARPQGATLTDAVRALPDLIGLVRRLARDDEVPKSSRITLWFLVGYLLLPFDLVPDFIPGLGYADDAIVVAIALRHVVRKAGEEAVVRNWRGSEAGLSIVRRLAGL
jgi:uncharacterized membrane protein YkvA (DUF1232 family)